MTNFTFKKYEKKIVNFCKRHHILSLALFGSVLTSNFKKTSDIDVLVKFEKKHLPNLIELVEIEEELSQIFGRSVDLKTPNDLSPYFRDEVLVSAKLVYGK